MFASQQSFTLFALRPLTLIYSGKTFQLNASKLSSLTAINSPNESPTVLPKDEVYLHNDKTTLEPQHGKPMYVIKAISRNRLYIYIYRVSNKKKRS